MVGRHVLWHAAHPDLENCLRTRSNDNNIQNYHLHVKKFLFLCEILSKLVILLMIILYCTVVAWGIFGGGYQETHASLASLQHYKQEEKIIIKCLNDLNRIIDHSYLKFV